MSESKTQQASTTTHATVARLQTAAICALQAWRRSATDGDTVAAMDDLELAVLDTPGTWLGVNAHDYLESAKVSPELAGGAKLVWIPPADAAGWHIEEVRFGIAYGSLTPICDAWLHVEEA